MNFFHNIIFSSERRMEFGIDKHAKVPTNEGKYERSHNLRVDILKEIKELEQGKILQTFTVGREQIVMMNNKCKKN